MWQPDPSKELNDGTLDLQVYSDGQGAVAIAVPDANDATILQFIEIFGDVNGGSIDWSATSVRLLFTCQIWAVITYFGLRQHLAVLSLTAAPAAVAAAAAAAGQMWQPDPSKELNDGTLDLQVYSDGQGAVAIAVPDANDATILQFIEIFGDVNGGSIDWSANVSPASVYMSDMGGNYVPLDATIVSAERRRRRWWRRWRRPDVAPDSSKELNDGVLIFRFILMVRVLWRLLCLMPMMLILQFIEIFGDVNAIDWCGNVSPQLFTCDTRRTWTATIGMLSLSGGAGGGAAAVAAARCGARSIQRAERRYS